MHVRPGDIRWVGNRFLAEDVHSPYKDKFRVEAELLESDGRASGMLVSYSTGNTSADINAQWRIKYLYDRGPGPEFFPTRIKAFLLLNGKEVETDDFEILKLELAEHALPPSRFDPRPMLEEHPLPLRIFTNDVMYQVMPDGHLQKVYATAGSQILGFPTYRLSRQLALWGLCVMNFLFLVLLLKTRKRAEA